MKKDLSVVTYDNNEFAPMKLTKIAGYILAICITFALICLWPFAIIWAINLLFSLNIQYTFWTWLACLVFLITLQSIRVDKK